MVYSPIPTLTATTPITIESGAPPTTITVRGESFLEGAVVLWHGQPRPTRRIDAGTLAVDLTAVDLVYARTIGITVLNPEPRLRSSNTLPFVISPSNPYRNFLPRIDR